MDWVAMAVEAEGVVARGLVAMVVVVMGLEVMVVVTMEAEATAAVVVAMAAAAEVSKVVKLATAATVVDEVAMVAEKEKYLACRNNKHGQATLIHRMEKMDQFKHSYACLHRRRSRHTYAPYPDN